MKKRSKQQLFQLRSLPHSAKILVVLLVFLFPDPFLPSPLTSAQELANPQGTTAADELVIRIGLYENPPKIFTDENGEPAGFWPELLQYIAREESWVIEWVPGTWEEGLQRLENNQIDIMPDTGWTEPRGNRFAFSTETVLLSWTRLYVKKGTEIQSILDLEGKTIGALAGSFNLDGPEGIRDLTQKFEINCTFIPMESYTQVFQSLERGEIDAGVANKDFGNQFEGKYKLERTSILFQPARLLFAFPKDAELTPYLIERIDNQIENLKRDNRSIYYLALDQYLGGDQSGSWLERIPKSILFAVGAGLGLIIILFSAGILARIQVRRRTASLEASEKNFRQLAENLLDGVAVVDETGRHIYVNPEYAKITGYSRDELLRMSGWELTHPEDAPFLKEKMAERLAGIPHQTHYHRRVIKKDGTVVPTEMSTTLINWEGEKRPLAVIRDITKYVEAEAVLRQNKEDLEELISLRTSELKASNEDLESFAFSVSHDLKAPLRHIDGFLDLLKKKVDPQGNDLEEYFEKIQRASDRMHGMINALLRYSRLGQQEVHTHRVQLDDLVNRVISDHEYMLENRKVNWIINPMDPVETDPILMTLIIENLIINALKFTSTRDTAVIEIGSAVNKGQVEVYVKDNGVGFDIKNASNLFGVFQRLHSRDEFQGNGIGLANVKRAVGKLGGEVKGIGYVNQGATFTITLPKAESK